MTARLLAYLAVVASPAAARADVGGELAAGAAADTAAAGYATASGSLDATLQRGEVPIEQRCLALSGNPPDDRHRLWFYSNADDGDRDGLHAEASGLALRGASGDQLLGSLRGVARGCGWQLALGVAYQPFGSLRDQFWRSGRGVVASTVGVEIPPMLTFGSASGRFAIGGMTIDFTSRTLHGGGAPIDAGLDVDFGFHMFHWVSPRTLVDVLAIHLVEYDAPSDASSHDVAFDFVSVTRRPSATLEWRVHAGFDELQPMTTFTTKTQPDGTVVDEPNGPHPAVPRYGLDVIHHAGRQELSLGAGSWARIDPTGNAADLGQLATAGFADRFGPVDVRAAVELGRLRRIALGLFATPDLAPVGTVMWMGRAEVSASWKVERGFYVKGAAWLERSDRDDPRWLEPATGQLALHAGADISATVRFRELKL